MAGHGHIVLAPRGAPPVEGRAGRAGHAVVEAGRDDHLPQAIRASLPQSSFMTSVVTTSLQDLAIAAKYQRLPMSSRKKM